jgi:hypothetical protein
MHTALSNNVEHLMPPAPRTDRRAAIRQCLGKQASTRWFTHIEGQALHLFVTEDNTLLLVDHQPICTRDGEDRMRPCILATEGTCLTRTSGPVALHPGGGLGPDQMLVGSYHGQLGGLNVLLEQYQLLHNGVLRAKVLALRRIGEAPPPVPRLHDALAARLLSTTTSMPILSTH